MKMIAYPVMILAAVGTSLSVSLFALGLAGTEPPQSRVMPILFGGIFVVWFPTVILMNRLTRDFKQKDIWKAALRGCPQWMRTTLWIVIGAVFALFFLSILSGRNQGSTSPAFVHFPITFYSISFCTMYSLINVEDFDASRRCLNGHRISPLAKFCDECGAPAAPDQNSLLHQ